MLCYFCKDKAMGYAQACYPCLMDLFDEVNAIRKETLATLNRTTIADEDVHYATFYRSKFYRTWGGARII